MPYLKGDNPEASAVHELYQSNNDQHAFLRSARDFLMREQQKTQQQQQVAASKSVSVETPNRPPSTTSHSPIGTPKANTAIAAKSIESLSPMQQRNPFSEEPDGFGNHDSDPLPPQPHFQNQPNHSPEDAQSPLHELERKMLSNLLSDDDDPVIAMPIPQQTSFPITSIGGTIGSSPARSLGGFPSSSAPSPQQPFNFHQAFSFNPQQHQSQAITPPRPPGLPMSLHNNASSPFSSVLFPSASNGSNSSAPFYPPHQPYPPQQQVRSSPAADWTAAPANTPTPKPTPTTEAVANSRSITIPPSTPSDVDAENNSMIPETPTPLKTTSTTNTTPPTTPQVLETPKPAAKKEYQPKRLWTRYDEQPGKILANNVAASMGIVVDLRPRQELTAKWMLPLSYLRERSAGKNVTTIRDAIAHLAVGLFRRGCTENGAQASIVSKEILTPPGESRSDYPFQIVSDNVVGTIPFYSPRTPGHVVFRLYWQDDPLMTLATGPTLNVRVTEEDFESSIRFILSNFKAKKVNPTSLSSLNSFALVLDQFQLSANNAQQPQQVQQQLEGAGRAVWGCICEARKVLDACAAEYSKTTSKLQKLEEAVEELKSKVDDEEEVQVDLDDIIPDDSPEVSEIVAALRDKQKSLMSGRASCERKWRDSQLAFASILKAVVTNPSMALLLRRELVTKLRLEYELWCPLCEEFAVPGDSAAKMWYEPLQSLPHSITADHFRLCTEARSKMQLRILGFDPNTTKLESILYPARGRNRQMNPSAVSVFNQLSAAMGHLYQDVYTTAERIYQQREIIRSQTEKLVSMCDGFPAGTKVAIFGSSANGFGYVNIMVHTSYLRFQLP